MKTECVVYFDGYLAEQIKLLAERSQKSVEDFVLSLFELRCIAPNYLKEFRNV